MATRNWTAGTSFNQPYSVSIPSSLSNNNYIYATIDVGVKHFSNIILAVVQNPTYSQLQSQIVQLQSSIIDLIINYRHYRQILQISKINYQLCNQAIIIYRVTILVLQLQIVNLSSEKASLQTQLTTLQTELNALNVREC